MSPQRCPNDTKKHSYSSPCHVCSARVPRSKRPACLAAGGIPKVTGGPRNISLIPRSKFVGGILRRLQTTPITEAEAYLLRAAIRSATRKAGKDRP